MRGVAVGKPYETGGQHLDVRPQRGARSRAWLIVALLFSFMAINFADKAVLGLAAGAVMRDLGLSHTNFGFIGAGFFAFFSLSAVTIGVLANRVPTQWLLAAMVLVWSACQLPVMLAASWPVLLTSRVVLGLGEGAAYPVALPSETSRRLEPRRARRHHVRLRCDGGAADNAVPGHACNGSGDLLHGRGAVGR